MTKILGYAVSPVLNRLLVLPCGGRGNRQYAAFAHMTLQEAVQLAPKHNREIRIASYTVEEKSTGRGSRRAHVLLHTKRQQVSGI
jgi:hypothetical protein